MNKKTLSVNDWGFVKLKYILDVDIMVNIFVLSAS